MIAGQNSGGNGDIDRDSGGHADIDGDNGGHPDIDGDGNGDDVGDTKNYPYTRIVVLHGQHKQHNFDFHQISEF